MASPLRVQIHLNLAEPKEAENVVRVRSASGAWVGVAYAKEILLANVTPVVDPVLQKRIENGDLHKVPHAFLEGDLVHFRGRWRDLAPSKLKENVHDVFTPDPGFEVAAKHVLEQGVPVNYNPRFASCFYADKPQRQDIDQRFIGADRLLAVGWQFMAMGATLEPLTTADLSRQGALDKTTDFERQAIGRGRRSSLQLLRQLRSEASPVPVARKSPAP